MRGEKSGKNRLVDRGPVSPSDFKTRIEKSKPPLKNRLFPVLWGAEKSGKNRLFKAVPVSPSDFKTRVEKSKTPLKSRLFAWSPARRLYEPLGYLQRM